VAINHLLDELKAKPVKRPTRPASPNRAGFGIEPKDKKASDCQPIFRLHQPTHAPA